MTDKLSEYELLNIMDGVFSYYLAELGHERDKPRIRQTKKQIVALIKNQPEGHGGLKKLQEEITEEWIDVKAIETFGWASAPRTIKECKDFIRALVEEGE